MIISEIIANKKKKGLHDIYSSGTLIATVHKETLCKLHLRQGRTIENLPYLLKEEALFSALEYAYLLLGIRSHTEKEIGDKLKRKGYGTEVIAQTLEKLKSLNLLDDKKFTLFWIERQLRRGHGIRMVRQELRYKGIAAETITESERELEVNPDKEYAVAETLFKNKVKLLNKLPPEKIYQRVASFLLRRGFSLDTANELFRKWKAEYRELPLEE